MLGSPRRALEAKFYAGSGGESMRAELWLWVVAGATPTRLTLTALVGKGKTRWLPVLPLLAISRSARRLDLGPLNLQLRTFGR